MTHEKSITEALRRFAANVTAKMTQITSGEPEDQLRGPFESFMASAGAALGSKVICTGETPLPDRLGRPDYAVHIAKLLTGYVELKAPGVGAIASRYKGHNKKQFQRFSAIPNILYADGNEWALYRSGKLVGRVVRLPGDVAVDGMKASDDQSSLALEGLLRDFLAWKPVLPTDRKGEIDLAGFAGLLAPLCRLLREDVSDALKDPASPLIQLAKDWRQLLFPDASDEQFADAYAQTVTFALLLGRSEGADPLTLDSAESSLAAQHNLLSRALQVLTDPGARSEMVASLDLLLRVIAEVPPAAFVGPRDPWLYFYEDFLAAYDPALRKDVGAYYTPVEVVHCQVRLIDDLLVNLMNKPLGFADPGVVTLDPAVGTGTYLLGVIEHALNRVEEIQGVGAVAGQAATLAKNLYGFEIMVGPYAVAELRVSRALRGCGASLPVDGTHVYLTDTLESPHATPPQLPLFLKPIAEQHAKALRVKSNVPVIVCLGNPPYDRHEATTEENKGRTGGWVRWGDREEGKDAIFRDFLDPVTNAGHGVHVKNLYNLYVYFWRWALWKVLEHKSAPGPGVISFISASSYLDGDAFCGMREHMRRQCDAIWVIDLGGEGRGTRKSDNVFAIQTPVAIAVAVRAKKKSNSETAAKVHYARVEGSREEKLAILDAMVDFGSINWQACPDDWHAPFRPAGRGDYFTWPLFTDLMPWQHSGVQLKRTWPIAPDEATLTARWKGLLHAPDKATALRETGARRIDGAYDGLKPLASLAREAPPPRFVRYGYRSFDRHWLIADSRLTDRMRPDLWRIQGDHQVYFASLFSQPLGDGPALTSTASIPDLHHFRGSFGGKAVIPLYRTPDSSAPNILPGLLNLLAKCYGRAVRPEEFAAYLYGAIAHPGFTARFSKEMETREIRIPITKDAVLFEKLRALGARLLWMHTYGERFVPKSKQRGQVPQGSARCTKAVPDMPDRYPEGFEFSVESSKLRVGEGEFAPVSDAVFEFEVSGLKVVQSWLKYRMRQGAGKKSSPLDDIRPERWTSQLTTELLEMLWVLEATIEGYPEQAMLLDAVVDGECFLSAELEPVPEFMRKAPHAETKGKDLFD